MLIMLHYSAWKSENWVPKNQQIIMSGWSTHSADLIDCWSHSADLVTNSWYIADLADLVKLADSE